MSFSLELVREDLVRRAGERWEIYAKHAAASELARGRGRPGGIGAAGGRLRRALGGQRKNVLRRGCVPGFSVEAIGETASLRAGDAGPFLSLPAGEHPQPGETEAPALPDAFEDVAQLLASESRGRRA